MNNTLQEEYIKLGNALPKYHHDLNFKNHCYWRIALDRVVGAKWNTIIPAPAYKNLSEDQLQKVVENLYLYTTDRNELLAHNKESLAYRTKT
jgi:hypothetical protein